MFRNGVNYKNSTDMAMGTSFLIPGVGWVIGAVYFVGDPILKAATGKDASEHVHTVVDKVHDTYDGVVNWLGRIRVGF